MDKQKRVLVVEDDALLRQALVTELASRGHFLVDEASDGAEGLTVAFANKPDMILLDILMPEVDGIKFLDELRKDSWGAKAEVIIVSNVKDHEKIQEAMQHGVGTYFVKSDNDLGHLIDVVKERLEETGS